MIWEKHHWLTISESEADAEYEFTIHRAPGLFPFNLPYRTVTETEKKKEKQKKQHKRSK